MFCGFRLLCFLNVLGILSVMHVKCFGDSVCYVFLMFWGFRLLCLLNVSEFTLYVEYLCSSTEYNICVVNSVIL